MNRRAFVATAVAAVTGGCLGDVASDGDTDTATAGSDTGTAGSVSPDTESDGDDTYRNPVFEAVFADPTVVRADGDFYAYATYQPWEGGEKRSRFVPVARSPDLVNWRFVGEAFESKPDWRESGGLWAPDIGRLEGRYVLYYSYASFGDPNPGIGVGVASSPTGPFEDRGELLRSDDVGVPNSIDPCLLSDDGTPYLFWGSKRGIHGVRLGADGLSLDGDPFQIAGDGVEAAYVVRRGDRYYFFGSRGTCCEGADSTYHVVVGRSDSLRGPYENRDGESLLDAAGTTILAGDDTFAGPGHNSVVRDDAGDDWLLYHAYERANAWDGDTPRRVLMLDRLAWRDEWPTVPSGTPSRTAPVPTVDSDDRGTGSDRGTGTDSADTDFGSGSTAAGSLSGDADSVRQLSSK